MDIVRAFNSNELHTNIIIKGTSDNPLFRASDIGKALDIANIRTMVNSFDNTEKVIYNTDEYSGSQEVTFLTEKGLYKVLLKSRAPIAEELQDWVCDLIKDIRLNGTYQNNNHEFESRLCGSKNDNKYTETGNKESYAKLLKEKESDRQKILLTKYCKYISLIYIIKIQTYDNGMYVIKIGESCHGITNIFAEHKVKYDNAVLLDCFATNRNKDFESFIHNHKDVKPNQVANLEGRLNERGLFLIGKNLSYLTLVDIIKNNVKYFEGSNTEQVGIENVKPITTDCNDKSSDEGVAELFKMYKTLLNKINVLEQKINHIPPNPKPPNPKPIPIPKCKDNDKITVSHKPLVTKKLVTFGPRIQKFDPDTFLLVQVYDSIHECMNDNPKLNSTTLNKCISDNSTYEGFRWRLERVDL